MKTHRETYPEQYMHPLVGKRVRVSIATPPVEGVVERVMQTRFGPLADIGVKSDNGNIVAYSVSDCELVRN